jgi:hypothetical protein
MPKIEGKFMPPSLRVPRTKEHQRTQNHPKKNFVKETLKTRQQIWVRVLLLSKNQQLRQDVAPTVNNATAI